MKPKTSRKVGLTFGVVCLAVTIGLITNPASGNASETWHFPTPVSASAFITQHHQAFADQVRQATNNQLKIVVHPGGSLFKSTNILRAVRTNQVQMGSTGLFLHSAEEPLFALNNLPFLTKNLDESIQLIKISRQFFDQALRKKNLKLLYRVIWPPQGMFSSTPLTSPADLAGMRIRTYDNTTTSVVKLANGIPTKTETSEIALAFSTGIVEGCFTSVATGVSQKLWDYVDHFYELNVTTPTSSVIVNLDAWNKLNKATQTKIEKIATDIEQASWADTRKVEATLRDILRSNGINVLDTPTGLTAQFETIRKQMVNDWLGSAGNEGRAILQKFGT